MPTLPPLGVAMAVLMPITWPSRLKVGPPELPWLIEASSWRKSSNGPEWMSRLRADTTPTLTLPPSPNGLPTAITQSPTRATSESPNVTAVSGLVLLILSSARSVLASVPTSFAGYWSPLVSVTWMSLAWSMTWLLVTT